MAAPFWLLEEFDEPGPLCPIRGNSHGESGRKRLDRGDSEVDRTAALLECVSTLSTLEGAGGNCIEAEMNDFGRRWGFQERRKGLFLCQPCSRTRQRHTSPLNLPIRRATNRLPNSELHYGGFTSSTTTKSATLPTVAKLWHFFARTLCAPKLFAFP